MSCSLLLQNIFFLLSSQSIAFCYSEGLNVSRATFFLAPRQINQRLQNQTILPRQINHTRVHGVTNVPGTFITFASGTLRFVLQPLGEALVVKDVAAGHGPCTLPFNFIKADVAADDGDTQTFDFTCEGGGNIVRQSIESGRWPGCKQADLLSCVSLMVGLVEKIVECCIEDWAVGACPHLLQKTW